MRAGDPTRRAGEILAALRDAERDLATAQAAMAADIKRVASFHKAGVEAHKEVVDDLKKDLQALCKGSTAALFNGGDQVGLEAGVLLRAVIKWVVKRPGTLDRIEEAGLAADLIKTAKSVDWDQVGRLDDEDLAAIGTHREDREVFSYELK